MNTVAIYLRSGQSQLGTYSVVFSYSYIFIYLYISVLFYAAGIFSAVAYLMRHLAKILLHESQNF